MSLWTCPTHGMHGPMPGNVCPTCGAAMLYARVSILERIAKEAQESTRRDAFMAQPPLAGPTMATPQQGANAAEQASGEEFGTGQQDTLTGTHNGFGIFNDPDGWYAENKTGTCLGPFDISIQAERAVDSYLAEKAASGEEAPTHGVSLEDRIKRLEETLAQHGIYHDGGVR